MQRHNQRDQGSSTEPQSREQGPESKSLWSLSGGPPPWASSSTGRTDSSSSVPHSNHNASGGAQPQAATASSSNGIASMKAANQDSRIDSDSQPHRRSGDSLVASTMATSAPRSSRDGKELAGSQSTQGSSGQLLPPLPRGESAASQPSASLASVVKPQASEPAVPPFQGPSAAEGWGESPQQPPSPASASMSGGTSGSAVGGCGAGGGDSLGHSMRCSPSPEPRTPRPGGLGPISEVPSEPGSYIQSPEADPPNSAAPMTGS